MLNTTVSPKDPKNILLTEWSLMVLIKFTQLIKFDTIKTYGAVSDWMSKIFYAFSSCKYKGGFTLHCNPDIT